MCSTIIFSVGAVSEDFSQRGAKNSRENCWYIKLSYQKFNDKGIKINS